MIRRRQPSDAELIRYLEGEVTPSRAGQIVVLAESNAAQRKRIEALENMLDVLARPDPRVEDIDLMDGIYAKLEAGEPPRRNRIGRLFAAVAFMAGMVVMPSPIVKEKAEHQENVERAILSVLSLDDQGR